WQSHLQVQDEARDTFEAALANTRLINSHQPLLYVAPLAEIIRNQVEAGLKDSAIETLEIAMEKLRKVNIPEKRASAAATLAKELAKAGNTDPLFFKFVFDACKIA